MNKIKVEDLWNAYKEYYMSNSYDFITFQHIEELKTGEIIGLNDIIITTDSEPYLVKDEGHDLSGKVYYRGLIDTCSIGGVLNKYYFRIFRTVWTRKFIENTKLTFQR